MKEVKGFIGEYAFLSNFYPCRIEYEGLIFQSSEAAYQAAKSLSMTERERFTSMSASTAKKEGRLLKMRWNWEEIKDEVMYDICLSKFSQEKFKSKLISTGDSYLEETNWWNDRYWGVCRGIGENKLGHILMEIRYKFIHNV